VPHFSRRIPYNKWVKFVDISWCLKTNKMTCLVDPIQYTLNEKKVTNANIFSHLLISFSLHYDVIVYITWKDDQTLQEDSIVLRNLCIFFVACLILLLVCPWLVVVSTRLRKKSRTSSDRPFRSSLLPADSLKIWFQVVVCKNCWL